MSASWRSWGAQQHMGEMYCIACLSAADRDGRAGQGGWHARLAGKASRRVSAQQRSRGMVSSQAACTDGMEGWRGERAGHWPRRRTGCYAATLLLLRFGAVCGRQNDVERRRQR